MVDLDSIKLDLRGINLAAVEATGRAAFCQLYLDDTQKGIRKTHDGKDVYFYADSFDYAFSGVSQWETSSIKDTIEIVRVQRVKWIKEFIAGNVANSQCWAIPVSRTAMKRLYCSVSVGYVVWLNPRSDKETWKFKTAYPAQAARIWEYTREVKGSKLVDKF